MAKIEEKKTAKATDPGTFKINDDGSVDVSSFISNAKAVINDVSRGAEYEQVVELKEMDSIEGEFVGYQPFEYTNQAGEVVILNWLMLRVAPTLTLKVLATNRIIAQMGRALPGDYVTVARFPKIALGKGKTMWDDKVGVRPAPNSDRTALFAAISEKPITTHDGLRVFADRAERKFHSLPAPRERLSHEDRVIDVNS